MVISFRKTGPVRCCCHWLMLKIMEFPKDSACLFQLPVFLPCHVDAHALPCFSHCDELSFSFHSFCIKMVGQQKWQTNGLSHPPLMTWFCGGKNFWHKLRGLVDYNYSGSNPAALCYYPDFCQLNLALKTEGGINSAHSTEKMSAKPWPFLNKMEWFCW